MQPEDIFQQGAFATSSGANQRHKLSWSDRQVEVLPERLVVITCGYVAQFNNWSGHTLVFLAQEGSRAGYQLCWATSQRRHHGFHVDQHHANIAMLCVARLTGQLVIA